MAVWRNVHRVHNLTESSEASAHLSIHVRSYLWHPASPFNQPSVQPPSKCINPHPSLCCRWVCFVDPSVTAVSERQARWVMQRGKRGCLAEPPPPPPEGGNGELTRPRSKAAGVDRSYQLSGVSWVSMSTLQMGHFLLVASHWSTHPWWKRCMQGNLLQTQDFKMKFRTSKKMFSNNKSLCFETGLSAKCQLFQNSPVFSSDI